MLATASKASDRRDIVNFLLRELQRSTLSH